MRQGPRLHESSGIYLGARYRDKGHGTEGIARGVCEWVYGCITVKLERIDADGHIINSWFDLPDIELVGGAALPAPDKTDPIGPPG